MVTNRLRALVVDDEPRIQKLLVIALRQQGFECDLAANGAEAELLAAGSHYDAVVTDLKMPNRNGHELICTLLKQPSRPVIVAHTGVIEPRLARDLLNRGVDDVLFKPVDFGFLALKVRQLVDRRQLQAAVNTDSPSGAQDEPDKGTASTPDGSMPISLAQLNYKLASISRLLPISSAAIDVFTMTRSDEWEIWQIAAAIQRDASLAAEVLRLANSALYKPNGQRVIELDTAVARIGQKRIGELALMASTLAALTPEALPWLDIDLTWNRSMAAGIALESLVEIGGHQDVESGLMLSTIMHPLGRVALGMIFPKHYDFMIAKCEQSGESLEEQERRIFPTTHTEVMAHLLATWKVPPDVFQPLKFLLDDFRSLVRLSGAARTRTELVKTAIVLGRIAAGSWQSWDSVQLPSQAALKRLRITNVRQIIRQTREDLSVIAGFHPGGDRVPERVVPPKVARTVSYCDLSEANNDQLLELLPSMGLRAEMCSVDRLPEAEDLLIINCLETPPEKIPARRGVNRTVVVTDCDTCDVFDQLAAIVVLPSSFGRLQDAMLAPVCAESLVSCNT